MSSAKRLTRKEKLWRLASDARGNEHERKVAELAYHKVCAEEMASPRRRGRGEARRKVARPMSPRKRKQPVPSEHPEFNQVERALIGLGAALIVGAGLMASWLSATTTAPFDSRGRKL